MVIIQHHNHVRQRHFSSHNNHRDFFFNPIVIHIAFFLRFSFRSNRSFSFLQHLIMKIFIQMVIHLLHVQQHRIFQSMIQHKVRSFTHFFKQISCVFFFLLVNSFRTVNWAELLPKITINIDPNRFHSIGTGLFHFSSKAKKKTQLFL